MRYLGVGVLGLATAVALLVRVDAVCAQSVTAGMLRADGPFAVGVTRLTYTKSSVATGEPRVLTTPVWFPIDGPPGGDPQSGATTVRRGKWPLILFSHGDCSLPELSTFFTTGLASRGFIVAAPPHPGDTTSDIPQCEDVGVEAVSDRERVPDIEFVIDQLLAATRRGDSAGPDALFFHRIDRHRIGMSGHSHGGLTTLQAAAADPRIRGSVAMAPEADRTLRITSPMLILTGELDTVTPFASEAEGAYQSLAGPRFLLKLLNAGHCAFVAVCITEFCGAGCEAGALSLDAAHAITLRVVVPFLKRYVAGEGEFGKDLPPRTVPEGIQVVDFQSHASAVGQER